MAAKKVSEARTKYEAKAKSGLKDARHQAPQLDLAKSVEALNQNLIELQSKLEEVNHRLAIFELRVNGLSTEERGWLMLAEPSFGFWDNKADAIYDTL